MIVDGMVAVEKSFTSNRRHNSRLFQPLSEIIVGSGRRPIDAVLVGSGPGSYSGTRVGIAAAQGAALVSGCKAVTIPSVLGTPEALSGDPCIAIGDARREAFWMIKITGGIPEGDLELTDPTGLDTILADAAASGKSCFCIEPLRERPVPISTPTASGLWAAWQSAPPWIRARWSGTPPQPIYIRPPHITSGKSPGGKIGELMPSSPNVPHSPRQTDRLPPGF